MNRFAKIRHASILILLMLLVPISGGATSLIVSCGKPKGPRVDITSTSKPPEYSLDKMTGVNPIFLIDEPNVGVVTLFWGGTKILNQYLSEKTKRALVI